MPIIREWRCADCGTTGETMGSLDEVICPTCNAQEAERVFLTAPSIKSPQTTFADAAVRDLAQTHGLSDVSNKDGESVMARHGQRGPTQAHARFAADAQQVLAGIPAQHRNSMASMGKFGAPMPHYVGKVKA